MRMLQKHPDLRNNPASAELQNSMKKAQADVKINLAHLELLKPRIKKRYDTWEETMSRIREDRERWALEEQRKHAYNILVSGQRVSTGVTPNESRFSAATEASDKSLDGRYSAGGATYGRNLREVDPDESQDIAVQLAHNEFRARGSLTRSRAGSSSKREGGQRQKPSNTYHANDSDEDLSSQIRAVGIRREQAFAKPQDDSRQRPGSSGSRAPQYPSVPKHSVLAPNESRDLSFYDRRGSNTTISAPTRPPKEHFQSPVSTAGSQPPPIPNKESFSSHIPEIDSTSARSLSTTPTNGFNAALDSRKFTFKPTATTEGGTPQRTIFMNSKLRSRFLTIALANTSSNLETCGILCGRLISNAFFVFKLVIPEQESTSDTCETVNEGALFDYCDKEDLITLGWIHTHPTQTCFMSSRDLHTHAGYQVQLAESVAIVCAPRHEPS
jgi:STAM-binding protein